MIGNQFSPLFRFHPEKKICLKRTPTRSLPHYLPCTALFLSWCWLKWLSHNKFWMNQLMSANHHILFCHVFFFFFFLTSGWVVPGLVLPACAKAPRTRTPCSYLGKTNSGLIRRSRHTAIARWSRVNDSYLLHRQTAYIYTGDALRGDLHRLSRDVLRRINRVCTNGQNVLTLSLTFLIFCVYSCFKATETVSTYPSVLFWHRGIPAIDLHTMHNEKNLFSNCAFFFDRKGTTCKAVQTVFLIWLGITFAHIIWFSPCCMAKAVVSVSGVRSSVESPSGDTQSGPRELRQWFWWDRQTTDLFSFGNVSDFQQTCSQG